MLFTGYAINVIRGGKKYATLCILVTKGKNAYYEFFSKNKIERESYMDLKEYGYSGFKIRDIEDIRPITEYSVKEFEKEQLIDFIMQLNGL